MKVIKIAAALALSSGCAFPAMAQEAAADADFRALQALSRPRSSSATHAPGSQPHIDRKQQIALLVHAAGKAKEFYDQHPTHPKAGEARKIEASSLLRAARDGAVEHEEKALRLARDFRWDKKNSSRDRFEIAAFMREFEVQKQNFGESREDALAAYEKAARDLYGEFPDEPALYDLFLGVARNAEPVHARRVANQVLLMPAPATAKDEARTILGRLDMVGKPFEAEWVDEAGVSHRIQDKKGRLVVFYLWAMWAGAADPGDKVKALVPGHATVVSVNVDQDVARAKESRAKLGIPGIAYYDERGMNSPLARQLRATKVPGFYVVNARGEFVGGGGPEQLVALLNRAGQE